MANDPLTETDIVSRQMLATTLKRCSFRDNQAQAFQDHDDPVYILLLWDVSQARFERSAEIQNFESCLTICLVLLRDQLHVTRS